MNMKGSSLTPEGMNTPVLRGDTLILGKDTLTGVYTAEKAKPSVTDIVSFGGLQRTMQPLQKLIEEIDPDNTLFKDNNVISLPLTDPFFEEKDVWITKNWDIQNGDAFCLGGYKSNSLSFDRSLFVKNGKYLFVLAISKIESGRLDLYKNETEWLKTLDQVGVHYIEVSVEDITTDTFSLIGTGVNTNEIIEVCSFGIHFIADRFYNYLIAKVKSLATIDAEGFVPRDEYEHQLELFIQQFQEATSVYLKSLVAHKTADNPHGITPAKIEAARVDHTHDQYLTKQLLKEEVASQMNGYSKIDHSHSEYLRKDAADDAVRQILEAYIAQLISVAPMIITKAPEGILPSRYAQTDISIPLTLLQASNVQHTDRTSFDLKYGMVSTNVASLIGEAPKVFSCESEKAHIPHATPLSINFRIELHHQRKIYGYLVRCTNGYLSDWSVYSGNTTFLHKIANPVYQTKGKEFVYEVLFDTQKDISSLSFLIANIEKSIDASMTVPGSTDLELKIELLWDEYTTEQFGISPKAFQFCVPTSGANRLIDKFDNLDPIKISPTICIDGLPMYVFGKREMGEDAVSFETSFYPPEYGNIRKGLNVLLDKFSNIQNSGNITEQFIHPGFGTLELKEGYSKNASSIKNIYSSNLEGWVSQGSTNKAVIEQTFLSDNVVMTGYLMSWRNEEINSIPDTWTLTLEGFDKDNKPLTIVMDSVEQYYPFYSVEDDDIVYHKHFDTAIRVKKCTLVLESKKTSLILSLNKLFLYLSEHFYSIPQNTMYLGLTPVSEMCLGRATYGGPQKGFSVDNLYLGRSCTIPVNNLKKTETLTEYEIFNPFFSTNVTVTVQNYALMDEPTSPAAYITSVTPEKITLFAESQFVYAISISRTW